METKNILLSKKEGVDYWLFLYPDSSYTGIDTDKEALLEFNHKIIYSGSVEDFLNHPNKVYVAEKVVDGQYTLYKNYSGGSKSYFDPFRSLLSAIGEYNYLIITETEI